MNSIRYNHLTLSNNTLHMHTKKPLAEFLTNEFPKFNVSQTKMGYHYQFGVYPNASFSLLSLIKAYNVFTAEEDAMQAMKSQVRLASMPIISLYKTGKHVQIKCPPLPYYMNVVEAVGGSDKGFGIYTVPIARAYDVVRAMDATKSFLPPFTMADDLKAEILKPLPVNSIADLYTTRIDELHAANSAYRVELENFRSVGYENLADMLLTRPRRYIDKTQITDFSDLEPKEPVTFIGQIVDKKVFMYKHASFDIKVANTVFQVTFYNRSWMSDRYDLGEEVLFSGEYSGGKRIGGQSLESLVEAKSLDIVPIYPQSPKNNITSKLILNNIYEMLSRLNHSDVKFAEYMPEVESIHMDVSKAFNELHFPSSSHVYMEALETLAFYEMTFLQLLIMERKNTEVKARGLSKPYISGGYFDAMKNSLPWELTDAQKLGLNKMNGYMSSNEAEQVLLSADVGSGKTLIAQLACMQAVDNGYQAVLAGPTEVLAKQLFDTFDRGIKAMPEDMRPTLAYLGGSTKAADKRAILKGVKLGQIDILVGTHSVLNTNIQYKNLGFIVIDEQQKFGSAQREALLDSRDDGRKPDLLAQTATPIPRSTAQAFYGDIDIIQLDGKPPGRTPVVTEWIKEDPKLFTSKKHEVWEDVKAEIAKGHQAFVVVPMVVESAKVDAASVEGAYKSLQKLLPGVNIGFMHGQMAKDKQAKAMEDFRTNETQLIVASTVIEVGVDVPNATRIVVLSADRMGASSLHQIRGRVGRSSLASKAYLVSLGKTDSSKARLQALVDSDDGFEIAKVDLKTRGEGDLFGLKQSGETSMTFANLVDHSKIISDAQAAAKTIYNSKYRNDALRDANAMLGKRE